MRVSFKDIFTNSFLAVLISAILMFMVFAVRTILDPMYKNPQLISTSKQVFSIFLWPYYQLEKTYIGVNPDFSHRFHVFWSPVGGLLTLLYIILIGNIILFTMQGILRKKNKV